MAHHRMSTYSAGDHWNVCQRCGFDIRQSESMLEWTGLIVCQDCWEPRHEQDFVYAKPEQIASQGLTTSEPADRFIAIAGGLRFNYITNSQYIGLI